VVGDEHRAEVLDRGRLRLLLGELTGDDLEPVGRGGLGQEDRGGERPAVDLLARVAER
jgi:hypothetical protein